jgi:hypothetical protein
MSLQQHREEFAAALSSAPNVKGYAYPPKAPKAGDAWPVLGQAERAVADNFMVAWSVAVYLPQDIGAADQWIDNNTDGVIEAIETNEVGFVVSFAPSYLVIAEGEVLGLTLTLRSE